MSFSDSGEDFAGKYYDKSVALEISNKYGYSITDYVISMYEMYHSEAIENAFADLDRLIAEKE